MPSGKRSAKARLDEYLRSRAPGPITEAEWGQLATRFDDVSPGYLRRLLRASAAALGPLVEGVRQEDFSELERTLLAIGAEYVAGDAERRRACRNLVIEAKRHAQFAASRARSDEQRRRKQEMVLWLRVWLDDPAVFPLWQGLRRQRLENASGETPPSG